nr:MAG TPA: hypothetical protein [Caudoviricetes sp.]
MTSTASSKNQTTRAGGEHSSKTPSSRKTPSGAANARTQPGKAAKAP